MSQFSYKYQQTDANRRAHFGEKKCRQAVRFDPEHFQTPSGIDLRPKKQPTTTYSTLGLHINANQRFFHDIRFYLLIYLLVSIMLFVKSGCVFTIIMRE